MKSVILALLVVLVVGHSEALRCNCGGKTQCSSRIQTCSGSDQVCASIRFNHPATGYFQSCYPAGGCQNLIRSGIGTGSCCSYDLCN
ncbi:lymphocyte antigen 6D-like isoform X4 [Hippoglossus hippoglossus]|nr:lymphocyte antigen 6D-like isoform X4 [Hippoglossus hippoglossus]XP_035002012.1 lymphocyte antigen 6D [Hippoglossus stenolepis]